MHACMLYMFVIVTSCYMNMLMIYGYVCIYIHGYALVTYNMNIDHVCMVTHICVGGAIFDLYIYI